MRTLPITLPREELAEFCRRHGIRRLSLYGSVLRDDFKPESDIDVLVEFEPQAIPGLIGISGMELELTTLLGQKVDLRTPQDLSRYFREEVVDSAETIYEAG
jgi:predicted nucleotidyltransferase